MIYLDNAATTLIKPRPVRKECLNCLKHYCANSGRSGHKASMKAGEKIFECRQNLAGLFNIDNPSRIVFTQNATMALNIAIKGIISPDSHFIISGMEHNSVLRPVASSGVQYSVAKPDETGLVSPAAVESLIKENTTLIAVTHASNIVGTINPICEIGRIAKKYNIAFLVDAAQTAGIVPIDVGECNISLLAFSGHKMLYGPTGTGGLYISPDINLKPLIEGGTGSVSESMYQPDFLPDRFESGTLNTLGIAGLNEGVKFVTDRTVDELQNYEKSLVTRLLDGLSGIRGIKVYGNDNRVGVVGFTLADRDSVEVANILDARYNIACRGGLHCAPIAHNSIGTASKGLVRFSVSCFTTKKDIDKAIHALNNIAH